MAFTIDAPVQKQEIRNISSQYELKNIYNIDENGLFFRVGLRLTYMEAEEGRRSIREAELQTHKRLPVS